MCEAGLFCLINKAGAVFDDPNTKSAEEAWQAIYLKEEKSLLVERGFFV